MFLTVHPGITPVPLASNLNWSGPGVTLPNMVTVQLGADGTVGFRNGSGLSVQVVADVAGNTTDSAAPVQVAGLPGVVTAVVAGEMHTCGATTGMGSWATARTQTSTRQ